MIVPTGKCFDAYVAENGLPMPTDELVGSGYNGVVYRTTNPKIFCKTTTDESEGLLMSLQADGAYSGIVPCHGAVELDRGLWIIWKEALHLVGEDAVSRFTDPYKFKTPWNRIITDVVEEISDGSLEIAEEHEDQLYGFVERYPFCRDIVETIIEIKQRYGFTPEDIHLGNIGTWIGYPQLVMFDAGMDELAEHVTYASCAQ